MNNFNFKLPFPSFHRIFSEHDLQTPVVVVSVIGKQPALNFSRSTSVPPVFNELFKNKEFHRCKNTYNDSFLIPESCYLEGCFIAEDKTLYLSLVGPSSTPHLFHDFDKFKEEIGIQGFLNWWNGSKSAYCKWLLFIFSMSHIVIYSTPASSLDLPFIQLLKVVSYLRSKYQTEITALMGKSQINDDWVHHGRLCSPRLLFLFTSCPQEILLGTQEEKINRTKKLEHSLEDQIYLTLRKGRLVKNVCNRAFFSIPPNDEFVFIQNYEAPFSQSKKLVTAILTKLQKYDAGILLQKPIDDCILSESELDKAILESGSSDYDHTFRWFVMKHVHKAHSEGFYDNMGKYTTVKPFFEILKLEAWFTAANIIANETVLDDINDCCVKMYDVFKQLLGTELQFSVNRCHKVIPISIALYQEGLPPHYSKAFHEKQVKRAVSLLIHHARGPEQQNFIGQLKGECDQIWKSGRQTCEFPSLFKNPCTKPMPSSLLNKSSKKAPDCEHWNGAQYISTCDCGVTQVARCDPFLLIEANYEFYRNVGDDCGCSHLDRFMFPIFQPSTLNYKAADVNNFEYTVPEESVTVSEDVTNVYNDAHNSQTSPTLSIMNIGRLWANEDSTTLSNVTTLSHSSEQDSHVVLNYFSNAAAQDKHLPRQASTTEYLPGMIHLDSPLGLLPQFPSWSLVCRGPSSLYSHNLGLHDQPGFLGGSNYLLPWDVILGDKDYPTFTPDVFKKAQAAGYISKHCRRLHKHSKDSITVKIFIGVEYECLRGHRFMCSAPGKVLKASGNGIVKENASKVTKGNMPLYMQCPCGKSTAQLMRIHIVTPKAPVHVTIEPQVRPAPNPCPVFVTGVQKPIALSQSAYWILRLPFVYSSERNCYAAPTQVKKLKYGELLGPMYGISNQLE